MDFISTIYNYLSQGGIVSIPLLFIFIVINYTCGFRLAVLFAGRKLDVRELFKNSQSVKYCVQLDLYKKIDNKQYDSISSLESDLEWHIKDTYQLIHMYSSILATAVLLAPLLGLLGTVIGMIETFASLSDSALYSSSGGIAGGISQALMTTQFGLVVAIPGVLFHRYLRKIELKTYLDSMQIKELFLLKMRGEL